MPRPNILLYIQHMKLEFTLTEQDLLTHQLFATSKSKKIMKRRANGKIFLLLIYMVVGLFIWNRNGVVVGAVYFLVCLPLYFLYAHLERKQYVKHISAFVDEQFKHRGIKKTTLDIGDTQIEMKDGDHESVIPLTVLEAAYETSSFYSLELNSGQSILIPKNHTSESGDTGTFLREMTGRLGIPYQEALDWKWR